MLLLKTPTDALDYKAAAIAGWHRMRPLVGKSPEIPNLTSYEDELRGMQSATPVLWPARFAEIAHEGAIQLVDSGLPMPALSPPPVEGYWHMCDGVFRNVVMGQDEYPVDSMLIKPVRYRIFDERPALLIRCFSCVNNVPVFLLSLHCWLDLPYREAMDEMLKPFTDSRDKNDVVNLHFWLMSAQLFLNQKLFEHSPAHVERHARKRYQQAGLPTEVHVVRLRTVIKEHENQSTTDAVDWTCRWMVRGHWTKQWYPSEGTHKTIWIMPYVKGPEDKPFRAPLPVVGAVVR